MLTDFTRNRKPAMLALLIGLMLFVTTTLVAASPQPQSAAQGEQIFNQSCTGCHTIGGGVLVGPDLQGVTQRQDRAWLEAFIQNPGQVIASGDPIANQLLQEYNNIQMPNMGLTPEQVSDVLAYIQSQSAGAAEATQAAPQATAVQATPQATAAAPVAADQGDPLVGRALFTGEKNLIGGGTPCISCHSVAGVGAFGGGALGPDLTYVLQRYGGQTGLTSTLASLPFPTMQGIFANRPLNNQEVTDLAAFFAQSNQHPAATNLNQTRNLMWGIGALGAIVLLGVMLVAWPRQRKSRVQRLREK
jgi:mono/diheme cytochrome c family protein